MSFRLHAHDDGAARLYRASPCAAQLVDIRDHADYPEREAAMSSFSSRPQGRARGTPLSVGPWLFRVLRAVFAVCLMAMFFVVGARDTHARLHYGEVSLLPGDAWDFSDSTNGTFQTYDVTYAVTAVTAGQAKSVGNEASSLLDLVHAAVSMAYIGYADSVNEKLDEAPTDPSLYDNDFPVYPEGVYVILTRDGHYAKIEIFTRGGTLTFRYTHQDDGSPSFRPSIKTQPVTWGRVKGCTVNATLKGVM